MKKIVLIRHGETEFNVQGRIQGQSNSSLTENGKAQAHALARWATSEDVSDIIASDLDRTIQTATPMSQKLGLTIRTDARLREIAFGEFEGMTLQEALDIDADTVHRWRNFDPDVAMPGGESRRQGQERFLNCLLDHIEQHQDGTLAIVSHGGVIAGFVRFVLGLPWQAPLARIANISLSRVVWQVDQPTWKLQSFNEQVIKII